MKCEADSVELVSLSVGRRVGKKTSESLAILH